MSYQVILETDADGVIVVRCPDLPGCVSQGRTVEEAMVNIQDMIRAMPRAMPGENPYMDPDYRETLEGLEKHGEEVPE